MSFSGDPIHVDLLRISMKNKIEIRVPVRVHGEAPGVKLHGALMDHCHTRTAGALSAGRHPAGNCG